MEYDQALKKLKQMKYDRIIIKKTWLVTSRFIKKNGEGLCDVWASHGKA